MKKYERGLNQYILIFHMIRLTISDITVWAKESSANVGKRLNLYCDIAGLNFIVYWYWG